jgi:hypothetical protein
MEPGQLTQTENLSNEHAQDNPISGRDDSPELNQLDEMTEDRPEPEADSQAAPQNDNLNGETGGHGEPNLGSDTNSLQPNSASDLGRSRTPPDGSGCEPHNQDVGSAGTQAGDESAYTGRDAQPDDLPGGPNDWNPDDIAPHLDAMHTSVEFIKGIRDTSLDNDSLPIDTRERLHFPISEPLLVSKELCLCLDLYLATTNGSQATYKDVCTSITRFSPDIDLLSYEQFKCKLTELTGVVPIMTDMCTNSCVAFTGPFAGLQACPTCSTARYEVVTRGKKLVSVPFKQALTIPVGPQIQAQYRSPEAAWNMGHQARIMGPLIERMLAGGSIDVYDDVYCSSTLLDAAIRGDLTSDDTVLMLSIDGAQLFESKQSDCWIYIWVLLDLAPDLRYKKKYVLPGGFIPGPKKPKNLDLFVYTGLHHLSALQRDGLRIWDCQTGRIFTLRPYFFLGTADGPGLAALHGQVRHHGAFGCREYCGLGGRHKPGGPHYYPALLKPAGYTLAGCDHNDIDIYNLPKASSGQYTENLNRLLLSETDAQFKSNRKVTGLCKPSIFLGLNTRHYSGLPGCLSIDHMHVIAINLPDLLIGLWRGTIDCDCDDSRHLWDWVVLTGDRWRLHGLDVALCRPYFPGSFDCPPRNPAEKISSGYKAWEFLLYVFGLGPALLHGILPQRYWSNFCKLATGVRLLQQHSISAAQLVAAHRILLQFIEEYETLYYQRKVERLHFCRQSIHALSHLSPDTFRLGPGGYYSQWTLERMIGNLGEELKQPSKAYANIANCGLQRSQIAALHAMLPDLDRDMSGLPRGAVDIGGGYVLLRAWDEYGVVLRGKQADALRAFAILESGHSLPDDWEPKYTRWARLQLPNLQIARCAWKETERASAAESV